MKRKIIVITIIVTMITLLQTSCTNNKKVDNYIAIGEGSSWKAIMMPISNSKSEVVTFDFLSKSEKSCKKIEFSYITKTGQVTVLKENYKVAANEYMKISFYKNILDGIDLKTDQIKIRVKADNETEEFSLTTYSNIK